MRKLFGPLLFVATLVGTFLSNVTSSPKPLKADAEYQIAEPGMVAYAASYSSDATSEPKYTTQNSTTFQYLNLGSTLNSYRGDSVKVGIIDSGINYDHEDFMVSGSTKVKGDSKYYAYESSSWVYYKASQHGYSYIDDTLGHGTNVAATVAAAINSVGGLGLAPNVELYVYKVTNSSNGYEFGAIQNALMDAKTLKLDVINMSFQSYEHAVSYGSSSMGASSGCSTILSYYLNQAYNAGITLVGAAGNYNTSEPSYPGSNDHVINVGSLNQTATGKAGFSNYGSTIDLVAPGYVYVADEASNTAYTNTQGTSFSAPLVTAAIALYKQQNPSATPAEIESALYASCDEIDDSGSAYTNWAGNGSLNVAKFLGIEEEPEDGPTDIVINNPEVVDEELTLEIGDTFDLDWTVNGNGTFDDSVNFYCLEDNGVLSVNSSGQITTLSEGMDCVVIESNADSNVYTQVYVTVTSSGSSGPTVSSVTVSPANLALDLNGTKTSTLTATVYGDNNPSQTVSWSSSNISVATVSASGVVTAKATGNATITATSQQDGTKSGTCSVTVTDSTVHVTGVSLNKNSTSITMGGSETLTATVSPNNAANKSVTWASSNTSVATVSNGVITAKATGSTTITVTTVDGGHTATCNVTVVASGAGTGEYELITSTDDLQSGASYMITSGTSGTIKTIATSSNGNNRPSTDVTVSSNKITPTSSMMTFELGGSSGAWTFKTENYAGTAGYLNATNTTKSNYLQVVSSLDSYAYFSISFSSNAAVITCTGKSSRNILRYNSGNNPPIFSCYSSGQSSVYLWKETTEKVLDHIEVATPPSKLEYEAGEYFNPNGLVITETYTDSSTKNITYSSGTASDFTFVPSTSTALTTGNTSVSITYSGKTCSQPITVNAAKTLSSISISGYTTAFVEGDTFSFGGTVTAHYSDSTTENVTANSTFSGYNMTSVGNHSVTVSYTRGSTTKTASYSITVSQGTLSSIAVSGQTTTYMKNNAFAFDGTCTATFANGYQKTVTPTSVTSPDMTTAGQKTITVSFTYNGNTRTTTYDITVNSNRVVIEETTTSGYSVIGTITYPSNTQTISVNTLSISTSGYATVESNAIRLGSGSNTGTVSVTSTTSNITKVVVSAKTYGSDTGVTLTVGGTSNTITSSYANYTKEYTTATNSCAIATTTIKKRAYIESITVYETKETTVQTDISSSEDCQGLETFIDTYMHMNYVDNLGYCKDNEHHYYSTAKSAFNALNEHQRSLFTGNSAYASEFARLSAWATANGESLNSSNLLSNSPTMSVLSIISNNNQLPIILFVVVGTISLSAIGGYFYLHRKRENS